jgi:hypothetical protein
MNKKILSILMVASIALTGLFAYEAPSVILTAEKAEVDYTFKVQKLNAALNDYEDFTDGQAESVTLSSEVGTTNAFTIATKANGNMHDDITFTAKVTTGEFIDQSDDKIASGWYPVIVEMAESGTDENFTRGNETITYSSTSLGDFNTPSIGEFETTFTRGRHLFGTEIARFKLQYKTDDELVAGSYKSTTTVDIITSN